MEKGRPVVASPLTLAVLRNASLCTPSRSAASARERVPSILMRWNSAERIRGYFGRDVNPRGEMDNGVDVRNPPIRLFRLAKITQLAIFMRARDGAARTGSRNDMMAGIGERDTHGTADETVGSGDQHTHHVEGFGAVPALFSV